MAIFTFVGENSHISDFDHVSSATIYWCVKPFSCNSAVVECMIEASMHCIQSENGWNNFLWPFSLLSSTQYSDYQVTYNIYKYMQHE